MSGQGRRVLALGDGGGPWASLRAGAGYGGIVKCRVMAEGGCWPRSRSQAGRCWVRRRLGGEEVEWRPGRWMAG
jgi:hypothetical protein